MWLRPCIGLLMLLGLLAPRVRAQPEDGNAYSAAALVSATTTVRPGSTADIGLHLTMAKGWHVYWINPGDAGTPPSLAWTLPAGVTAGPFRWPFPERLLVPPLASYGYSDEVLLPFSVDVPVDFAGGAVPLRAKAEWLVCADVCLPASAELALDLAVGTQPPAPDPTWASRFAEAARRLPIEGSGWTVSAAPADSGYALDLRPPPGWSGTLDGAYFFADSTSVAQHPAPQRMAREGDAFRLTVPASEFAAAPATRLRGVVVLPEGAAWDDSGRRALAVNAVVGPASTPVSDAPGTAGGLSLALAVLLAFAGGVLLNAMPCVFPVLSIKLLGFVQGRTHERAALRRHGAAFAAGVLVSFWVLAGVLIALRASGEELGWGFQLQRPGVVAALALLLFGLGLNLAGLFEMGGRVASAAGQLDRRGGLGGAFLSGVLATVVATPCTAPFMGAALGYALAQPPAAALIVFTALGIGMALPYVLLASFPHWLARLPRPGPWMVTLRQALAFPLFLTVVWLAWVFGQQTGVDGLAYLLLGFVLAGLAAWIYGRTTDLHTRRRIVPYGLSIVSAALALYAVALGTREAFAPVTAASDGAWEAFEPATVEQLVAQGQPVFVDFTAAWCLSCQVNKRVALQTEAVDAAFRARGVRTFRADWTRRDPAITAALAGFGRSGVPLYVLYPGGKAAPVLLPSVLTPGIVLDALGALRPRATASRPPIHSTP